MVGYEPDLNPYIDWEKEMRELLSDDPPPVTKIAKVSKPVLKLPEPTTVEDTDYSYRLATPLIQVFSVRISTGGKPCEIYGSIRALQGSDSVFDLYNRGPQDSETILEDGTLSLIGPNDVAIIPSKPTTTLDLHLSDRVQGVVVVEGSLSLDPKAVESYDKFIEVAVEGAHGVVAYVNYAVFRLSIYGTIQVTVTKNDNAPDLYGSVVAGYANCRIYCDADVDVTRLETLLLNLPSHEPLHLVVGEPTSIKLLRNVVAVPSYSSLTIQVNLWDSNGIIARDCLQFPAHLLREDPSYIRTKNACVEVLVHWHHAYHHLYNYKGRVYPRTLGTSKDGELQNLVGVFNSHHLSASVVGPRDVPYGLAKVEVFTVFVGGITEKLSALCGSIIIDDGSDKFSIYKRDGNHFQLLEDDSLACIEFNYRAIKNCEFGIILKLKDPVRNLEVSRGELGWNVGTLESSMLWYGKRVCSVVRGKDGYAAVHYEIFRNAVEAFVEVALFASVDLGESLHLHGTLIGRYTTHDYSTSYQETYYTSRLFECPPTRPVELKSRDKIPLLKSIIVVPVKSSLRIDAKLGVSSINNVDVDIYGFVEFKIDMCKTTSMVILGDGYWIEVSTKFKV